MQRCLRLLCLSTLRNTASHTLARLAPSILLPSSFTHPTTAAIDDTLRACPDDRCEDDIDHSTERFGDDFRGHSALSLAYDTFTG